MPVPIICASAALCQFAQAFRLPFSKPQFKYFEIVLVALMQIEGRRTLSEMQRHVAARWTLSGLSRFFACSSWSQEEVRRCWQRRFTLAMQEAVQQEHHRLWLQRRVRAGRPRKTLVSGYLIMDGSTHHKPKGKKMRSLGRHHSTTYDKRVPGHSLFQGLYVLLGRRCPLAPKMYRTKRVCQQEDKPFQSKVALSVACVEGFAPVLGTKTPVLVDAWYMNQRLWKAAKRRDFQISGGIANNRLLRREGADGQRFWQSLSEWAKTLAPEAFEELTWPSASGAQKRFVHCVRTRIPHLGACQVLCVKDERDDQAKKVTFYVCSLLEASVQEIVNALAVRWEVETFFGDFKELLGSDHYQMMSDTAIVRFWTLGCLAYLFLDEQRAKHATIGQTRRLVQEQQHHNLLAWVFQQCQQADTLNQVQRSLAA